MLTELSPDRLRRSCDPTRFAFGTTAEVEAIDGIVGQPRATSALRVGLGMANRGYHIFIAGRAGTGKMTAVNAFLAEAARTRPAPDDTGYVYNFSNPERPRVIRLPRGQGRQLASDLDQLLALIRRQLPQVFESDDYTERRDAILKEVTHDRETRLSMLDEIARAEGFALQATPIGLALVPLRNGEPMAEGDFNALSAPDRASWQLKRARLEGEISRVMKELRQHEATAREKLSQLDRDVTLHAVGGLIEDVAERYTVLPLVTDYLAAVRDDLVGQVDMFRASADRTSTDPIEAWRREQVWRRYRVNVLVDGSGTSGAPVVVEPNPTYANLVGRVEHEAQFGVLLTDFTLVRAGALHRANGGYLVLRAEDVLRQPLAWDALKRALRSREIVVEDPTDLLGLSSVHSIHPEPVPLDVKVVLTGDTSLFKLLHELDPDFPELFRVHGDFADRIPRTEETEVAFAGLICRVCQSEELRHFDRDAVALLVEHAARLAEDQEKLSAHFGALTDLVREANYWATQSEAPTVTATHVRKALDEQVYRSGLIEENLQEMIANGTLLVDTTGSAVGQINGLGVYTYADYSFALPSRITATVGSGREGVVDVEREANLSGRLHSKGVLILAGFLTSRFARTFPLSIAARLTFEQSYGEVEGDSASSAELYALLSALADAPIRQGLAVTGSVNQKGEIQAIGGVNEKIEGFFATCCARGLTGDQGVLIPAANVRHLMLREDVVAAVTDGQFHVYPLSTVDEGIELLTGISAGRPTEDGEYPSETINGRVMARLQKVVQAYRALATGDGNGRSGALPPLATPRPVPPNPSH